MSILKTDAALIYDARVFKDFLKDRNVTWLPRCPYTPYGKSFLERHILIVRNIMRQKKFETFADLNREVIFIQGIINNRPVGICSGVSICPNEAIYGRVTNFPFAISDSEKMITADRVATPEELQAMAEVSEKKKQEAAKWLFDCLKPILALQTRRHLLERLREWPNDITVGGLCVYQLDKGAFKVGMIMAIYTKYADVLDLKKGTSERVSLPSLLVI